MTPFLFAIIAATLICAYFYARVVVKERVRHLETERDAEASHALQWKELAVNLTERGLLFRELPMLKEDLALLTKQPEPDEGGEKTLADLEDELGELSNPINFSSQGELGRRRELAKQIALRRRNQDLRDGSGLSDQDFVGDFGAADIQQLGGR